MTFCRREILRVKTFQRCANWQVIASPRSAPALLKTFLRQLAISSQPHLLTLQSIIARENAHVLPTPPRSIVLPSAKFGSLTGSQTGSKSARFVCPRVQLGSSIILERPTLEVDEACRFSQTTRGRQGQRQGVIEPRRYCCYKIGWILLRSGLVCAISMCLGFACHES